MSRSIESQQSLIREETAHAVLNLVEGVFLAMLAIRRERGEKLPNIDIMRTQEGGFQNTILRWQGENSISRNVEGMVGPDFDAPEKGLQLKVLIHAWPTGETQNSLFPKLVAKWYLPVDSADLQEALDRAYSEVSSW